MLETHPYKPFTPKGTKYLIIGSFPGHQKTLVGDWYYATKRGQFWPIFRKVYISRLETKSDKQKLLEKLHIGLTDIISKCERKHNNNSDNNLTNIFYNTGPIKMILAEYKIERIYFTSRFVEGKFKRLFKNVPQKLITLPSSSPRYAKMSLEEKARVYKRLLPKYS